MLMASFAARMVTRMLGSAEKSSSKDRTIPYRDAHEVSEVAVLLGGIGVRYVWTLIARGDLPSFKLGRRRMVAREDIDALIAKLKDDEQQARAAAGAR